MGCLLLKQCRPATTQANGARHIHSLSSLTFSCSSHSAVLYAPKIHRHVRNGNHKNEVTFNLRLFLLGEESDIRAMVLLESRFFKSLLCPLSLSPPIGACFKITTSSVIARLATPDCHWEMFSYHEMTYSFGQGIHELSGSPMINVGMNIVASTVELSSRKLLTKKFFHDEAKRHP